MKYVIDTSVVVDRVVSKLIKEKKVQGEILVPKAVMSELENQANMGRETGLIGLEEIQTLQALAKKNIITIALIGERPTEYEKKNAKRGGAIDAAIRDLAYENSATLITADLVQAESAKAMDITVMFIAREVQEQIEIESFFDKDTMSVHLKEETIPVAKKGGPGNWKLTAIEAKPMEKARVEKIAKEIVEKSRIDPNAFIEISRRSTTIIQYKDFRIVIVKPPVADGWEITAVKPLVQLNLSSYTIPEKIMTRLEERSSGFIIAGQVGSGKSTFAQALAEHYAANGRITKTIESPRDLVLSKSITQYSKNLASSGEIHDIIFLSRPDNVIFDEMRDSPDFKLYVDIRLGGSAVIGVLHAASPIDAVQRFIGRIDVGTIPSVLDTIIFIDKGKIAQVLTVRMKVKVPSGMTESDLARPVIEVKDLASDKLIFEIYSYGEQTVVIPVGKEQKSPAYKLAEQQIQHELQRYAPGAEVEMIGSHKVRVYVPKQLKAKLIGPKGATIQNIEQQLGINIDIQAMENTSRKQLKRLNFNIAERGRNLIFQLTEPGLIVDIFIGDTFLFSSTTGKKGDIRVNRKSDIGQQLIEALDFGKKIYIKG